MPVPPLSSQPARRCACALLLFATLSGSLAACVREHTLFDEASAGQSGTTGTTGTSGTSDGGAAGSAGGGTNDPGTSGAENSGAPGTTQTPWDEAHCVEALSAGKDGEACLDTFKCTATADCCQILGVCTSGSFTLQKSCDLCIKTCTTDADCGSGKLCDNYECHDCPAQECPDTWSLIIRSDCKVCVPPNECKEASGAGCPVGDVCIAGLTCLPSCKDDPACCFGNRCAPKECGPPKGVDCLLVGCPAGTSCKVAGPAANCACDPKLGTWSCTPDPQNQCAPL